MDEFIKRLSERLSDQAPRRGFLSTMGKAALAAAALITGQDLLTQSAEAASLHCCTGGSACPNYYCPTGSRITYTWQCGHPAGGGYYICHDCTSYSTHRVVCIFSTYHA